MPPQALCARRGRGRRRGLMQHAHDMARQARQANELFHCWSHCTSCCRAAAAARRAAFDPCCWPTPWPMPAGHGAACRTGRKTRPGMNRGPARRVLVTRPHEQASGFRPCRTPVERRALQSMSHLRNAKEPVVDALAGSGSRAGRLRFLAVGRAAAGVCADATDVLPAGALRLALVVAAFAGAACFPLPAAAR